MARDEDNVLTLGDIPRVLTMYADATESGEHGFGV